MRDLHDQRRDAALALLQHVSEALRNDEHVQPLKARLEELERDAMRLLTTAPVVASAPAAPPTVQPTSPPMPPTAAPGPLANPPAYPPVRPAPVPALGRELVDEQLQLHLSGAAAAAALDDLKARLADDRNLELTLSWRLQRKGVTA